MKKVNFPLSFSCRSRSSRKCAAFFTAVVIVFTAFTCVTAIASDDNENCDFSAISVRNQKMILELSESYLSPNIANNISVLDTGNNLYAEKEEETINLLMTTDSENTTSEVSTQKQEADVQVTETTPVKVTEATTSAPVTTTVPETQVASASACSDSYSFAELGITQMSDIPVPDSIRFDANGIPLNYSYKLSGKSTTYNMGTMTATGTPVHPGVVAVNPKIIPYGSKMYIVASDGSGYVYGYSSAEDTGGFIYMKNGPLVDLYVYTMDDVYYWANKPVTIYVF